MAQTPAQKKAKQLIIVNSPKHDGIVVNARQKLADPDVFDALLDELPITVGEQKRTKPEICISDLDVSQNKLSTEQFEALFQTLTICGVRVERYRMFGCATLNDEVAMRISEFFKSDLTNEIVPSEMHLTDCAITTDGFLALMDAFETAELYPLLEQKSGKSLPLYLRLENNYIDENEIKEKVKSGCIRPFTKKGALHLRTSRDANHRIDLVCKVAGAYEQKAGPPPAPEDAAPPKYVNDWKSHEQDGKGYNQGKGKGKDAGKDAGKGLMMQRMMQMWEADGAAWPEDQWSQPSWGAKGGGLQPSWGAKGGGKGATAAAAGGGCGKFGCKWCALGECWSGPAAGPAAASGGKAGGAKGAGGQVIAPRLVGTAAGVTRPQGYGGMAGVSAGYGGKGMMVPQFKGAGMAKGATQTAAWNRTGQPVLAGGKGKLAGSAGSASDRSRTPIGRGAAPPTKPPPAAGGLPPPWEEHFDEDNQIPYFWNSMTGEAVWEKGQCI